MQPETPAQTSVARIMHPIPDPNDPLVEIPAVVGDVRNLMYHIWPSNANQAWRWNVERLRKYMPIFNGKRIIAVVTDETTASIDDVVEAFNGIEDITWIFMRNDPSRREGVTFYPMMDLLQDDDWRSDDSITFYAHAKGGRYKDGGEKNPLRWAGLMYQSCLNRMDKVIEALQLHPITGSLKRYGPFTVLNTYRWHYSGTFFWFRNRDVFKRNKGFLVNSPFCVEIWPSTLFKANEAHCLIGDNAGHMYDTDEIVRHERSLLAWNLLRLTRGLDQVARRSRSSVDF